MDVSDRTTQEIKSSSYRGDKVEQLPRRQSRAVADKPTSLITDICQRIKSTREYHYRMFSKNIEL
jgi:hypothetical protein